MTLVGRWGGPGSKSLLQLNALALGAGILAGLGQEPHSFPLAMLAGLAMAFALALRSRNPWSCGVTGTMFGIGYFGHTLIWLTQPFQVDAATHGWLAPFALVLTALGLALLWGTAFLLARSFASSGRWLALMLIMTMTSTEMAREHLLTGFPWALPGYTWSNQPLGQIASIIGIHGLTAVTLVMAVLPLVLHRRMTGFLASLLVFGILHVHGLARLYTADVLAKEEPVVRLVQPNIKQERKWSADQQVENRSTLLSLSTREADNPPDLIIWPETAITWFSLDQGNLPDLLSIADQIDAPLITGITRRKEGNSFNSALMVDRGVTEIHHLDKQHLVPFGEYLPMAGLLANTGILPLAVNEYAGFASGEEPGFFTLDGVGLMRVLICYEAIFPRETRRAMRPDVLVQITNDAWFGTWSGPQQHFQHSRMRSVELGLPLLRVANTGISAVVDSHGRIISSLPLDKAGTIDVTLPPALEETFYSSNGDLPVLLAILALAALQLRRRFFN